MGAWGRRVVRVYRQTRKRHDQLWNTYVMRPLAAVAVVGLSSTPITPNQVTIASLAGFVAAAASLVAADAAAGVAVAIVLLELSYLGDCVDGMLARHRGTASREGHLFDFFTDESKALLLVAGLSVHLWRQGGYGIDGVWWPPGSPGFLLGGVAAVFLVASATSLTNFVRRPEISGRATPVAAHYEAQGDTVPRAAAGSPAWLVARVMTLLRFLNHYPSHIWLFALAGRLDVFFWMYASLNGLYLGRGWLGLLFRFGRPVFSGLDDPRSPSDGPAASSSSPEEASSR
ncbi:MAG: CDP-alcohol phosphatidyltransferase family protein [Myxococcota bacterium]